MHFGDDDLDKNWELETCDRLTVISQSEGTVDVPNIRRYIVAGTVKSAVS